MNKNTKQIQKGERIKGRKASAENYVPLYEFLLFDPIYKDMSEKAKVLYSYLRDKVKYFEMQTEAAANGVEGSKSYLDEEGNVYILADNVEISYILNVSEPTVVKIKKELTSFGLLDEERESKRANRIYVLTPSALTDRWVYIEDIKKLRAEKKAKDQLKNSKRKKKKVEKKVNLKKLSSKKRYRLKNSELKKVKFSELKKFKPNIIKGFKSNLISFKEEEEEKNLPSELVKFLVSKGHKEKNAKALETRLIEMNVTDYTFEEVESAIEWAMAKEGVNVPYIYAAQRIEVIADPVYRKAQAKKKQAPPASAAKPKNKKAIDPYTLETYEDYLTWAQEQKQKSPRNKFDVVPEWMFVQKKFELAAKNGDTQEIQNDKDIEEQKNLALRQLNVLRGIGSYTEEEIYEALTKKYSEKLVKALMAIATV